VNKQEFNASRWRSNQDLINVYKFIGNIFRCAVSVMNLTGYVTYRFTASTAPSFENFRSQNSHRIATRIMKVYWSMDSFRLFPYRNTQSCCVGPETLKKLGKFMCLSIWY